MTRRNVTDEQFGKLSRRTDELKLRVDEGVVLFDEAMDGLQVIIEGRFGKMSISEPRIVSIDRSQPFDSVKFLGQGWNIEEQDERVLKLDQLDFSKVRLEHVTREGEFSIKGEEGLRRLKEAGYIRLDAKVFQILWENNALIPESWKQKTNGSTTYIFFNGTVLRDPGGGRDVLALCWSAGQWGRDDRWLEEDWHVSDPSVVLASI